MIKRIRCLVPLAALAFVAIAWQWGTAQSSRFDKLSDADREAMSKRFAKEIWPLMTRNGKDACVACHKPGHISGMRIKDQEDPDKAFKQLLKEGFFLADDEGAILYKVSHKDKKERMPPEGRPAWTPDEVATLKSFVIDLEKKQKK